MVSDKTKHRSFALFSLTPFCSVSPLEWSQLDNEEEHCGICKESTTEREKTTEMRGTGPQSIFPTSASRLCCSHLFRHSCSSISLGFLQRPASPLITAYHIFSVWGERMSLLLCYCNRHQHSASILTELLSSWHAFNMFSHISVEKGLRSFLKLLLP